MSLESTLRDALKDLVSGNVYPNVAPEGLPAPYIVYESSEGIHYKTLSGYVSSRNVGVTLNVVGNTYESCKTITSGVISRLQSLYTQGLVQDLTFENPPEEHFAEDIKKHISILDFSLGMST